MKNKAGELVPVEWEDVLVGVAQALKSVQGNEIGAIAGGLVDAEV
jgi:NADH dehydrogenase (ubiquinone) Fe-S protein 1